jgi:hypothetical protein
VATGLKPYHDGRSAAAHAAGQMHGNV